MAGDLEYLRSVVVSMNDDLARTPVVRWGVVTSVDPLGIRMDGDEGTLFSGFSSIVAKSSLRVGHRVEVILQNARAIIQGVGGGVPSVPIGGVLEWYAENIPDGYLLLNGQAISRTTYAELFGMWGTQFGSGNGSTTFNVPDRRGRTAVGVSTDAEFNSLGKESGAKTHTLTTAQMPSHTHSAGSNADGFAAHRTNTSGGYSDVLVAGSSGSVVSYRQPANAGSGNAHNNIQPSIAAHFIVRAL